MPAAAAPLATALRLVALVGALCLAPLAALAGGGWALGGMDAVGYRSQGAALPGRAEIATHWAGRDWLFASEENRAAFEANPRAYAPGLDGFCPVALAEGGLVPGNPRHFAVVGQRLYLLGSAEAKAKFLAAPRELLMAAREQFLRLRP